MKKGLLTVFIFAFVGNLLFAQQVRIKNLDESEFPSIKMTVEFMDSSIVDLNQLKILENNEPTIFTVDSVISAQQTRAICFLVNGEMLDGSYSKEICLGIMQGFSNQLKSPDLFNIIFINNKYTSPSCIDILSYEFTNDYSGFTDYASNLILKKSTGKDSLDYSCAMDSALEYLRLKKLPPSKKILITMLPEKKKAEQELLLWKEKASEQQIRIEALFCPESIANDEEAEAIKNRLNKKLNNLLTSNLQSYSKINKSFVISFHTTQEGTPGKFIISYKGEKTTATFSRKLKTAFFRDNLILIIAIGVLFIILIIIFSKYLKTKKNETNTLKKQDSKSLSQKNAVEDLKFDPKKTNYGNGSVMPFLTIDLEGKIEKFDLKKLRTTIGRHSDNDILIANLTVSNHHATITNEGGVFYIQDNESTNGTFVNDLKINKSAIHVDDAIRLGKAKLSLFY